jgi:zinc transporter 1/2/3
LRAARRPSGDFLSWGNAFAAGVFLGIGLIHMLSAATATWTALGWTYPMAFVLAATAFVTILLLEHVLLPEAAHEMVHSHSGEGLAHVDDPRDPTLAHPYTLVFTLSIHSFLAGIALGAQLDLAGVLVIFIAIIAHKSTAGFVLGVRLAHSRLSASRSLGLLSLFAVTTPAGILLGMLASGLLRSAAHRYFDAVFQALAAGTFIYIAALDIIQDEFVRPGSRLVKWLFATGGLLLMGLLALWI